MKKIFEMLQSFKKDEKGQTVVEYALMLALVALAVAGTLPSLTGAISGVFTRVIGNL